jgi:predicted short-subunit dehydrogenase-like oxidoreductase (DUF2520 family)
VTVAIIGQGAMGRALGTALRAQGVHPIEVHARGPWPDLSAVDTVILAVRDDALVDTARAVASRLAKGKAVLHCSGAMPAREALAPLLGYARVGTLHPLASVVEGASFPGVAFAVEGDEARALALLLGGVPFEIAPEVMPLYHAAAVFASNYVVTLLDVAARLAERAGLSEAAAREALGRLCAGTVDNFRLLGGPAALTGPIARGDESIVAGHLAALPEDLTRLYEVLAAETRRLAARRSTSS